MIPVLVGLFACYVIVTAWFMRRALSAQDPAVRFVEAKRLLWTSALGVPLLIAFIIAV